MLYVTKSPPPRTPSLRAAAPNQRAVAKAAPPAPAKPPAMAASGPGRGASSTRATAATKPAASSKGKAVAAPKAPVPLPEPRQAPPKVQIGFPALPVQARAARFQDAQEQQADLARYRKFLSVARMVAEARKLTDDERHQIAVAEARIDEIRSVAWSSVR